MSTDKLEEKLDRIDQKLSEMGVSVAEIKRDVRHFDKDFERRVTSIENHWKITKWLLTLVTAIGSAFGVFISK